MLAAIAQVKLKDVKPTYVELEDAKLAEVKLKDIKLSSEQIIISEL